MMDGTMMIARWTDFFLHPLTSTLNKTLNVDSVPILVAFTFLQLFKSAFTTMAILERSVELAQKLSPTWLNKVSVLPCVFASISKSASLKSTVTVAELDKYTHPPTTISESRPINTKLWSIEKFPVTVTVPAPGGMVSTGSEIDP